MTRLKATLAAFLFGYGMIAVLVGFLWDRYSWQTAIIAGAAFCVVASSLMVSVARGEDY